jgi:hypothetical protein
MNTFTRFVIFLTIFLNACTGLAPKPLSSPSSPAITSPKPAPADEQKFPDKIVASHKVIGTLTEFRWGDYFYAIVKTDAGDITFFMEGNDADCFLALNKAVKLAIQYDVVKRYLPQASGYHEIALIRSIGNGRIDLATWQQSHTAEQIKQCRSDWRTYPNKPYPKQ